MRAATRTALSTATGLAAFLILTALPARATEAASPGTSATMLAATELTATDLSAQSKSKRKKRSRSYSGAYSGAYSGQQIACTQSGCHPIPRGCRVVPGRIPFTWDPSGFDDIVCPYPR